MSKKSLNSRGKCDKYNVDGIKNNDYDDVVNEDVIEMKDVAKDSKDGSINAGENLSDPKLRCDGIYFSIINHLRTRDKK